MANNYENGDGISCYVGHRTQNVFAFADTRTFATVFIKSYPTFEEIHRVKDEHSKGYISLAFSDSSSCLVTLADLPNFSLTVWNWRIGEKIASQEGGILMRNQSLK